MLANLRLEKWVTERSAEVVFFDVGGTLIHDDPPVPEVFANVARRRGHTVTVRDAEPYMAEVNAFYQSEYLRDGDFWCVHERAVQLWLDMYSMLAERCGISSDTGLPQAVYDEYLLAKNWSTFPDVEACLKGLKRRGFRLAVVSNWDATLEELFRRMGLLPYFDEIIASATVGCRKPSKAIFDIALERMEADASQAVHVGDLPEADGDGAFGAGIRPVIIDRADRWENIPYERIQMLTDLVSLL